jgi:hypothetical protein
MAASWRHDLLGGVVFGIPPFVLVVVEVVWRRCGIGLGSCCCQCAEGPWVLEGLSYCARCNGELGFS